MARLIDREGANIRPSDVRAIEYSIHGLHPGRPESLTIVEGHDQVALDVGEVVLDSLQGGGLWTADDVGYNFRHEIKIGGDREFPGAGAFYQVRYQLTPSSGLKTILRFQLRVA